MRLLLTGVFVLSFLISDVRAASFAGVEVPDSVVVEGRTLALNGMGVRSLLLFKVYVGSLWLEKPSSDPNAMPEPGHAWRMRLTMLRDVSREQAVDAFRSSLERNAGGALSAEARERVAPFFTALRSMKKGEQVEITWVPGSGLSVTENGAPTVRLVGSDVGPLILGIWLGKKPADDRLKAGLLGGRPSR